MAVEHQPCSTCMLGMRSQHHVLGLQTECMLIVPCPMVDAVRILRDCSMALGYRCANCEGNVLPMLSRMQSAVDSAASSCPQER